MISVSGNRRIEETDREARLCVTLPGELRCSYYSINNLIVEWKQKYLYERKKGMKEMAELLTFKELQEQIETMKNK